MRLLFATARRRRLIAASDRARDRGDWIESADLLRQALRLAPDLPGIWVQYGHSLKESGRYGEAEAAYLRASALRPNDFDAFLHLGHARKRLGRIPDAVEAFATALRLNPECSPARAELLGLGAREALPEHGPAGARRARDMAALSSTFETLRRSVDRWTADAPIPPMDYAAFRALYPITPPPATDPRPVRLIVLAEGAMPAMVRTTILSLLDQTMPSWTATIVAAGLAHHSVASFAHIDARIAFADAVGDAAGPTLWIGAGTILDPQALAWMLFAASRSDAAALFADHDAVAPDWRAGPTRFAPRLYPMYDPLFFAATDEPPAAILTRDGAPFPIAASGHADGPELRRGLLLAAGRDGPVVHVPRTLFSVATVARAVTADQPVPPPAKRPPAPTKPDRGTERITVIIATRDLPDMLKSCVESLRATAIAPDLLTILILDNRSVESATRDLLARWTRGGVATTLPLDEPFNWARANNIGAGASRDELLCLVNNDTVCLTEGWDAHLAAHLRRDAIGVVGARLLYPDRTLQHGGVVMGMGRGSPTHEGVGADEKDDGPLGRWTCVRAVPAVTGAFLGIRRALFSEIGGLDEIGLPIGFNDIDLCLKVRQRGLRVIYEPAIALIHHESKTRGHNDTLAKLAWDLGELETFFARWGAATLVDPGYHPGWSKQSEPFDGFVEPGLRTILTHIDRSARADPWAILPDDIGDPRA